MYTNVYLFVLTLNKRVHGVVSEVINIPFHFDMQSQL